MIELLKPYFGGLVWLAIIGAYFYATRTKAMYECHKKTCKMCGRSK